MSAIYPVARSLIARRASLMVRRRMKARVFAAFSRSRATPPMRSLATLSFFPARFAGGPNHALSPIASFLSRLSLGKVAELERPRRHPKAFGIPSNLLTGTPSSVPCPRSDACRAQGVPSMCDYSLNLVASRAAKVGDELVTTKFNNSITRGIRCNRRAERGCVPSSWHGGRV